MLDGLTSASSTDNKLDNVNFLNLIDCIPDFLSVQVTLFTLNFKIAVFQLCSMFPLFVLKYQFKGLTQWRMIHAFCPKGSEDQNLRCKTLCQMLIMTENFQT